MAIPLLPDARRRAPATPSRSIYREAPVCGPVSAVAACAWLGLTGWGRTLRLLPDGGVDLVWTGDTLLVEPASAQAVRRPLPPGRRHLGLRLRPGAAGAVLGVAMDELDAPVALRDLWGVRAREIEGRLAAARLADHRRILEGVVALRLAQGAAPEAQVMTAVRALRAPFARVDVVAEQVGLSPRELHRRVRAQAGLGPKAVQRIARFQRAFAALRRPGADLATVALAAGYADQAHMSHDVRRLAGATPAGLRGA